ncbi:hypothetical protein TURU_021585 [Turdus rufiventris]|nr:hypothetical protein TURU_021585 [Turdus rufiventris]
MDHHGSLSVTMDHYQSPWITMDHCQSPWLTVNHHGSPWITVSHYGSLSITMDHYSSLSITMAQCQSPWITMDHCQSPWVTVTHHGSLSITMDHHGSVNHHASLSITVDHHGSLSITMDHHGSLWITMDHCGSPWITVNHCGSPWINSISEFYQEVADSLCKSSVLQGGSSGPQGHSQVTLSLETNGTPSYSPLASARKGYGIPEQFGWEGTFKARATSAMGRDTFHYPRLLQAPKSSLALDTARDPETATASLGTLCQGLLTLPGNNSFPISHLTPPSGSGKPFPASCPSIPCTESLSIFAVAPSGPGKPP